MKRSFLAAALIIAPIASQAGTLKIKHLDELARVDVGTLDEDTTLVVPYNKSFSNYRLHGLTAQKYLSQLTGSALPIIALKEDISANKAAQRAFTGLGAVIATSAVALASFIAGQVIAQNTVTGSNNEMFNTGLGIGLALGIPAVGGVVTGFVQAGDKLKSEKALYVQVHLSKDEMIQLIDAVSLKPAVFPVVDLPAVEQTNSL